MTEQEATGKLEELPMTASGTEFTEEKELQPIEAALSELRERLDKLLSEKNAKRDDALRAIMSKLEAEYGDRITDLQKEIYKVSCHLNEVEERHRREQSIKEMPYPIGTELVGWVLPRRHHGFSDSTRKYMPKYRGIVEIIEKDSIHPKNMKYRRAKIGFAVVRLFVGNPDKKVTGARYEMFSHSIYSKIKWLPVGKDCNK